MTDRRTGDGLVRAPTFPTFPVDIPVVIPDGRRAEHARPGASPASVRRRTFIAGCQPKPRLRVSTTISAEKGDAQPSAGYDAKRRVQTAGGASRARKSTRRRSISAIAMRRL
jgi:hypothetical protein